MSVEYKTMNKSYICPYVMSWVHFLSSGPPIMGYGLVTS